MFLFCEKMKIVKFLGGLGNQMFQYAFYLSLQQYFNNVKADLTGFEAYDLHQGYELEKVFGIQVKHASPFELRLFQPERRDWTSRKLKRLFGTKYAFYLEKEEFSFDPQIFEAQSSRYYWGYWQHFQYQEKITNLLRQEFQFKDNPEGENVWVKQKALMLNSISLHVRRGDYLDNDLLGNVCDLNYYQKSIAIMNKKIQHPLYIVFSNDIPWCQKFLPIQEAIFVDWNMGENSYKDMQLMAFCKHHIIANSSFSWWGAWLNPDPGKLVISPKKWVNHPSMDTSGMVLPNWITV
jgi:hypothetical protein